MDAVIKSMIDELDRRVDKLISSCQDNDEKMKAIEQERDEWKARALYLEKHMPNAIQLEVYICGPYELDDGRKFWLDAMAGKEIARRIMRCLAKRRENEK